MRLIFELFITAVVVVLVGPPLLLFCAAILSVIVERVRYYRTWL